MHPGATYQAHLQRELAPAPALKRLQVPDARASLPISQLARPNWNLSVMGFYVNDRSLFPVAAQREYGLSDRQSTDTSDRAVDSRGVLVRTNDRLHHCWRLAGRGRRMSMHARALPIRPNRQKPLIGRHSSSGSRPKFTPSVPIFFAPISRFTLTLRCKGRREEGQKASRTLELSPSRLSQ